MLELFDSGESWRRTNNHACQLGGSCRGPEHYDEAIPRRNNKAWLAVLVCTRRSLAISLSVGVLSAHERTEMRDQKRRRSTALQQTASERLVMWRRNTLQ
jgi:hypothetical protein